MCSFFSMVATLFSMIATSHMCLLSSEMWLVETDRVRQHKMLFIYLFILDFEDYQKKKSKIYPIVDFHIASMRKW